jgi:short subunit dehydrogenase-like uncharacterized protein
MANGIVAVVGATGHTGRFVAQELDRRGVATRLIGRNAGDLAKLSTSLEGSEVRPATIDDQLSLRKAVAGVNAVINCAGPFFDTSHPVITAALAEGAHYLDVTAEQVTVLDAIASFDAPALAAERVVMPAMAFFGGLADLLVTSVIGNWSHVDRIETAVALDSWHPTAGTRTTGARNTSPRLIVRDGELVTVSSPPPTANWLFPEPFGMQPTTCVAMSEIILLSRHIKANEITSFMNLKPLADMANASTPPPRAVDSFGRSEQRFAMSVELTSGGEVRRAAVSGRDIYAVTAPLVVEACLSLIAGRSTRYGVLSPGQIFDAKAFIGALGHVLFRHEINEGHHKAFAGC